MKGTFVTKCVFVLLFGFLVVGLSNANNVKAEDIISTDEIVILLDEDMKNIEESLISNFIEDSESNLIDDVKIDINTTEEITITRANGYIEKEATRTVELYITVLGYTNKVATLTHNIIYYIYDNGGVHIYKSTAIHAPASSSYFTSVYDQKIINTDGTLSTASCIFKITSLGGSWYYKISYSLYHGDTVPTVSVGLVDL